MKERLEAIVSGRVQMVMFRDFVQRKATGLTLVGEVRNLSNGTVEVLAEGERIQLEKLVRKLHHGSFLSNVETVSAKWLPKSGTYTTFKISYD